METSPFPPYRGWMQGYTKELMGKRKSGGRGDSGTKCINEHIVPE